MGNIPNEKQIVGKPHKSKFWIIGNIYFYIVGVNLVLFISYTIISKIIPFKETTTTGTFLFLVSAIASVFAIKWGVELVLKRSTIHSNEIFKISLLIGIVPIILSVLFSVWIILINIDRFAELAWYLIPSLLGEFITMFISGLFYGIVTYFWFKKLSNRF